MRYHRLVDEFEVTFEGMRWVDTDEDREMFTSWFDDLGWMFETRGSVVTLPQIGGAAYANDGDWILYDEEDDEFIAVTDENFKQQWRGETR